jgi:hypothetical protein
MLTAIGDDVQKRLMQRKDDAFGQQDLHNLWTFNIRSVNVIAHRRSLQSPVGDSPKEAKLYNPYDGLENAWQLTETVDEFLDRVPPLTHTLEDEHWIWIANPHVPKRNALVDEEDETFADFVHRGQKLLDDYREQKEQLLNTGLSGLSVMKRLTPEREEMKTAIFELATKCHITSGKVRHTSEFLNLSADHVVDAVP